MVVDAKTNRLTGGISAMPDPDLDQLRTAAAEASGRLLSALHGRQARLRAELDQVEAEIAAHERAVLPALAALGTVPASPPPNGPLKAAVAAAAAEALIGEPADLRDTPIGAVLSGIVGPARKSIQQDCEFRGVDTVRQLIDFLTDLGGEGQTLFELCSVEDEVNVLRQQLAFWCKGHGFKAAHIGSQGLPTVWLVEAERNPPPPVPAADLTGLAAAGQSWKPADLLEALGPDLTAWKRLKERGADDDELIVGVAKVFGDPELAPSGDGYSVAVSKKLGPQFWSTATGYKSKKPATLSGPSLLTAVRAVLEIPQPKQ